MPVATEKAEKTAVYGYFLSLIGDRLSIGDMHVDTLLSNNTHRENWDMFLAWKEYAKSIGAYCRVETSEDPAVHWEVYLTRREIVGQRPGDHGGGAILDLSRGRHYPELKYRPITVSFPVICRECGVCIKRGQKAYYRNDFWWYACPDCYVNRIMNHTERKPAAELQLAAG